MKFTRVSDYRWESEDGNVRIFWNKGLPQQGANGYTVDIKEPEVHKIFYTQKEAIDFVKPFLK